MCNRKTKFQELNTVSESESSLLPNLNNSHKFLRILWRKLMWNFGGRGRMLQLGMGQNSDPQWAVKNHCKGRHGYLYDQKTPV